MPLLDGDHDKLADYIRHMANLMGMQDWLLKLLDSAPEGTGPDCGGYCEVPYGRRYACIWIADDWPDWPDWQLRDVVTHELMHGHMAPLQWSLNNASPWLGACVFGVLEGGFRDALEQAIDAMSRAWARTLPMPVLEAEAKG